MEPWLTTVGYQTTYSKISLIYMKLQLYSASPQEATIGFMQSYDKPHKKDKDYI
jgi:hypothetical protein